MRTERTYKKAEAYHYDVHSRVHSQSYKKKSSSHRVRLNQLYNDDVR